jgi:hypothetical protein
MDQTAVKAVGLRNRLSLERPVRSLVPIATGKSLRSSAFRLASGPRRNRQFLRVALYLSVCGSGWGMLSVDVLPRSSSLRS